MNKLIIIIGLVGLSHCQPLNSEDSNSDESSSRNSSEEADKLVDSSPEDMLNQLEGPNLWNDYRQLIAGGIIPLQRSRRSLQPGAPAIPFPNQDLPTKITPHVTKQDGTTNVGVKVDQKFGNHDASVVWNKNIDGPGKAKPNYGVQGSFRF